VRQLAVRWLPEPVLRGLRRVVLWVRPVSMVSREPRIVTWFRRVVLRRKPVLYHFEIHITDHCNLNCKGCAHFSNLCKPWFADLSEFEADMRGMAETFSGVKQIYLLGGEPLLHPDVAKFVRLAREVFPKTRIYLMTNGTMVMRMDDEFWSALAQSDVILLCDSYPIGLPVDDINARGAERGVKVEWTVPREEFFKIPIDPAGGHDPVASFAGCQGYNNCPIVRDGRLYPCAYAAFSDVFREKFDVDSLEATEADSIPIRNVSDPEAVMEFLRNPIPWCANCDMANREFYTWGRSARDISEWTRSGDECGSSASGEPR